MSHKKISVVVLGSGDSLKKALITIILGKDLSQLSPRHALEKTEIYENDTYVVTCTPDLNTEYDKIGNVFPFTPYPDMSLMMVEDGFSTEEVWMQIDRLHRTTGKPKEEFIVVLPVTYKHTDSNPFKSYTMERLFSELSKLDEERRQMATNRYADHPESYTSTPRSPKEVTGGRNSKERFSDPKKRLKRMHSGTKVNLVLLGLAGTGKSASGNTILGKKQFMSRISSTQVTTECQEAETEIGGTHVRVIDTPDIFDDEIESSIKNKHVTKCKQLCQSGSSVYLLVMHVSRFTDGERDILRKLKKAFGSRAQEQTVILFTRGGDLWRDKMSLEDFLDSCQPDLKKIVEKCGNRCVLFENRATGSPQVEKLMQTVEWMLDK